MPDAPWEGDIGSFNTTGVGEFAGESEIHQDRRFAACAISHHHIAGLEIAVDDTRVMDGAQCGAQVEGNLFRRGFRHWPLAQQLGECFALKQFHCQKSVARGLLGTADYKKLMNAANVGTAQPLG